MFAIKPSEIIAGMVDRVVDRREEKKAYREEERNNVRKAVPTKLYNQEENTIVAKKETEKMEKELFYCAKLSAELDSRMDSLRNLVQADGKYLK